MVAPNSSNERPYLRMPTNSQPARNRNPMFWSIYSTGADDDQLPPAVPPKDPDYSPPFPSAASTSSLPTTYVRPRYTSFSAYEPQSASMPFPEPQQPRLTTRRSVFGFGPSIRHRGSKSDTGLSASTTSLSRPESNRESYVATVFIPIDSLECSPDPFRPARTPSFR